MIYSREFVRAACEAWQAVRKLAELTQFDVDATVVTFGGVNIEIEALHLGPLPQGPKLAITINDEAIAYAYEEDKAKRQMYWEAIANELGGWDCYRADGGLRTHIGNADTREGAKVVVDTDRAGFIGRDDVKEIQGFYFITPAAVRKAVAAREVRVRREEGN